MGKRISLGIFIIAIFWTGLIRACPISLTFSSENAVCPGNMNGWGKVNVTSGSGDYIYTWAPGGMNTDSIFNLTLGTYTVTVTDTSGGCFAVDSIQITSIPPSLDILTNTTIACQGDTVFISARAPIPGNYTWFGGGLGSPVNDSSLVIETSMNGIYIYYIQFTPGICDTVIDSITITVTSNPSISVQAFPDPACAGVNTNMVAVGPGHGSYIWSGGSLMNPFQGDTLPVTVNMIQTFTLEWFGPPPANCLATTNFNLNVVNLQLNINKVNPLCGESNGSITVNAMGGSLPYVYTFLQGGMELQSGPSNVLDSLNAGTFTVMVTESTSGCIRSSNIILVDEGFPQITNITFTNTPIICCDDVTDVIIEVSGGSGDYDFSWLHDVNLQDSIAPDLQSGTQYTVRITDALPLQCPFVLDSTITIPGPSECINIDVDTMPDFCGQNIGNITLHITGGVVPYNILWGDGSMDTILNGLTPGNYNYIVTDALGCTVVDNAVITNRPGPILDTVIISCYGFGFGDVQAIVRGKEPIDYIWSHDTINRPWDTSVVAGTYFLQTIDSAGCMSAVEVIEIPPASPDLLDLGPDTTIVSNQSVAITASTSQSNWVDYNWISDQTLVPLGLTAVLAPDSTTDVILMATNEDGCATFDTLTIFVDNEEIIVILPNLFTPNGDNINDIYSILLGAEKINNIEFQVFDRWGDRVFESRDPFFQWDGVSRHGEILPPAVYVYYLEYELFSDPGKKLKKFGDITLIR